MNAQADGRRTNSLLQLKVPDIAGFRVLRIAEPGLPQFNEDFVPELSDVANTRRYRAANSLVAVIRHCDIDLEELSIQVLDHFVESCSLLGWDVAAIDPVESVFLNEGISKELRLAEQLSRATVKLRHKVIFSHGQITLRLPVGTSPGSSECGEQRK
jgi:hypothetical protein